MIFGTVPRILNEERVVYSTNCVGKLDIHMQKNECERIHMQKDMQPHITSYSKINSRWIKYKIYNWKK